MKKITSIGLCNIKAFTLIELLIVTTIIVLMSASSIFYFLDFVQEQEISQKLFIIEDDIKLLDKKVKNYDILDYELLFNTLSTKNKSYITYINNFDTINQELVINDISLSGTILSINSGIGKIQIFKNNKLYINQIIDRSNNYDYIFNDYPNYKITGTFSGEILNDIILNYFSEDNLYPENNNNLELININTKENKTGQNIADLKITNIGGNKKLYSDGIEISDNEVYLFFENNGKEKFIKITK
ncbi:MAG: type II secretion system protein [Candidatus Gracilibacteria bacterium]